MEERFDTNEECRCLCIDKICNEFNLELDTIANVRKINNFIKTYQYFKGRGLVVEGYVDKRLLINPKYLLYLLKKDIGHNKKIFDIPSEKCIYMYYTTAKELYNIDEAWTHCICEVFESGERYVYDSYLKQLRREYGQVKMLSHKELIKKIIIVLKIRR